MKLRPPPQEAVFGLVLLVVLALPTARQTLESRMLTHMLVQYPAAMLCGALLAGVLRPAWRQRLRAWNCLGLSGLVFSALVLALLMIPRVLDLALQDGRIEAAKWLALLLCGAALRASWADAGPVVQGFFLGNVLPMMAIVGWLYEASPLRVCNAYRIDDQQDLGQMLMGLAAVIAAVWLGHAAWPHVKRPQAIRQ